MPSQTVSDGAGLSRVRCRMGSRFGQPCCHQAPPAHRRSEETHHGVMCSAVPERPGLLRLGDLALDGLTVAAEIALRVAVFKPVCKGARATAGSARASEPTGPLRGRGFDGRVGRVRLHIKEAMPGGAPREGVRGAGSSSRRTATSSSLHSLAGSGCPTRPTSRYVSTATPTKPQRARNAAWSTSNCLSPA